MLKAVGRVDSTEAMFLKAEVESGDNARAKRALQIICQLHRGGKRLQPADIRRVENSILGALSSGRSDEKVRRWCLSALSQFGSKQACWSAVETTIRNFPDEPQVVSSGIAALYKLDRNAASAALLKNSSISSEILTLSALQTIDTATQEFPKLTLDISKADETALKLALVLVGLNRAPELLFDKKFDNRAMVKELGGHQDALVSQYSVWAVSENPVYSTSDLGIDRTEIIAQPDNVRHYAYRLFAAENDPSTENFEMIAEGRHDDINEVRLGTAMGLRETYYEGLQDLTIPWFYDEADNDVRAHLLDHLVRHSEKQELYETHAIDLFEYFASDEGMRNRMMAAAAGKKISTAFKRIIHDESEGLFGKRADKVTYETNNHTTITNNGTMNGNNSLGGAANNSGQVNVQNNGPDIEKLLATLLEAKTAINMLQLESDLRAETLDAISAAETEPTFDNVSKASTALKKVAGVIGSTAGFAANILSLAAAVMNYV